MTQLSGHIQKASLTAVITGASRGLGLALAKSLAADGWRLIIDGRNPAALHLAAAKLGELTHVKALPGDISDPEHRESIADTAWNMGGLQAVVHNASLLGPTHRGGLPALRGLSDYPVDGLREVFEVNALAPVALTQLLAPLIGDDGRVVAVTSDAAVEAYEGWGGYGAAKAALEHYFAVFAAERPDLRFYRVDPGEMRTQMYQEAEPGEDISHLPLPDISVPGVKALLTGSLPSGRYQARSVAQEEVAA